MLQLKNIKKVYGDEGNMVRALKGINISFRECEFVSILGPSGCGKTTLLNIIGGLDVATEGDLIFDGVSTKGFNDADWDDYRNSKIGFVFQSYNLIPHLTVLDNVALALTISGITGEERIRRATEAIEMVGLKEQIHKLPNQMSGGQVQRVAIARAMVMQTPLLLADEPTGAIDSETSVQVMELLKDISKTRLVIMVTHNSELAEKYSTRIVKVLDGEIISDSDPYDPDAKTEENTESVSDGAESGEFEEITPENAIYKNTESVLNSDFARSQGENTESVLAENTEYNEGKGKARKGKNSVARKERKGKRTTMSFGAAAKISWRNLRSKRGRSVLTAIAGSIGIICIAIILAINNGFSQYIAKFEKQSLSKYPITVTTDEDNVTSLLGNLQQQLVPGTEGMNVFEMLGSVDENDNNTNKFPADKWFTVYDMFVNMLKDFSNQKTNDISRFKKYAEGMDPAWGDVKYDYSINLDIYRRDVTVAEETETETINYTKINPLSQSDVFMMLIGMLADTEFSEAIQLMDTFPFWDELVGDDETILAQYDLIYGEMPKDEHDIVLVVNEYNRISDFDALALGEYGDPSKPNDIRLGEFINSVREGKEVFADYKKLFEEASKLDFRVLKPSAAVHDDGNEKYSNLIEKTSDDPTLKEVLESEEGTIPLKISGILRPKPDLKDGCIKGVIGYSSMLAKIIMEDAENSYYVTEMTERLANSRAFNAALTKIAPIYTKLNDMTLTEEEKAKIKEEAGVTDEDMDIFNKGLSNQLKTTDLVTGDKLAPDMMDLLNLAFNPSGVLEKLTGYANAIDACEKFMYRLNLRDPDKPSYIYIYAGNVESKDKIVDFVNKFNAEVDAEEKALEAQTDPVTGEYIDLDYTHVVKCINELDSIVNDMDDMVNTITYILIAVALVSVIVTMFLIAIIMYISVQDRTREIGILRALGSRKLDISNIFNVETLILGLISGVIGVVMAFILQFPGNAITAATLNLEIVVMAWWHPFVLIIGSMLLTLIAGLIPAVIAAKKQPVIALRTEG